MVNRKYQICIDVDLKVEEIAEGQDRDGMLSDDASRACQLAVQRLLIDDPDACDKWLRQCLLWYLQDGVLQERLRRAVGDFDEVSPVQSIVGRLPPEDRRTVSEWMRNGTILDALEGLYDSVFVQRAVLRIVPVAGRKSRAGMSGVVRRGAVRHGDEQRDSGQLPSTVVPTDGEVAR